MTTALRFLILFAVISNCASGELYDVQISATPIKVDEQKDKQGGNLTVTTKQIAYKVSMENRSFKTMPSLEAKYMIFYIEPKPGSTEKPIETFHIGSENLGELVSHRMATFETKPIMLRKKELHAGWYWTGSGKSRLTDRVTGVWIRAYADGKIVGEYSNPTTVSKTREWKEESN
jgi:hypothetical protein